jgi:hypothetical protein
MIQLQIHIIQLSTIQNQGQNKKSKKPHTENYPKNFQTKSKVHIHTREHGSRAQVQTHGVFFKSSTLHTTRITLQTLPTP